MKNKLIKFRRMSEYLNRAITSIEEICRIKHKKFGLDTKVPYGYGIDILFIEAGVIFGEFHDVVIYYKLFNSDVTVGEILEIKNEMERIVLDKIKDEEGNP